MKKFTLIFFLFFLFFSLQARRVVPIKELNNYVYIETSGGIQELVYKVENGTRIGQLGGGFNVGYCYSYSQEWALKLGLGMQTFSTTLKQNYTAVSTEFDKDIIPEAFEFSVNYKDFVESQTAVYLEFPIAGQYKKEINPQFEVMATLGFSVSFPLSANYKTTGGSIATSAYYPRTNTPIDVLPEHGFKTYTDVYAGKLSFYPSLSLLSEIGGVYKIGEKSSLYFGTFYDYGLTNLVQKQSKKLFDFDGGYNGIMSTNLIDGVKSSSLGIKLGLYVALDPYQPARRGKQAVVGKIRRR